METFQYTSQNKIAEETFMGINEPIASPKASSAIDSSGCLASILSDHVSELYRQSAALASAFLATWALFKLRLEISI